MRHKLFCGQQILFITLSLLHFTLFQVTMGIFVLIISNVFTYPCYPQKRRIKRLQSLFGWNIDYVDSTEAILRMSFLFQKLLLEFFYNSFACSTF